MDKVGTPRRGSGLRLRGSLLRERSTGGAVYVEFIAVFFPLFSFFMSLVQFGFMQTASLVVGHASMKAARVAAVVLHDNPAKYGGVGQGLVSGARREKIIDAAQTPLAAIGNLAGATIKLNKPKYGRDDMVEVRVIYDYKCKVPIGRFLVCGPGSTKKLEAVASMPNQGAEFIYSK